MRGIPPVGRHEPAFPNTGHIARREYLELVRSRLFHVSTVTLTILAIIVALLPIAAKLAERGTISRVGIVADDQTLARATIDNLDVFLNRPTKQFEIIQLATADGAIKAVDDRQFEAALVATRGANGRLQFTFHMGETIGDAQIQELSIAVFGVALLDYSTRNAVTAFELPQLELLRSSGDGAGSVPFSASNFASRLIVGAVFGVLIFITIVIYGMWVAAGVVAEKSSRVMELLISAASPRQLVVGKALGIGAAGATQYLLVLAPAVLTLLLEDLSLIHI